jgi:hypothetical protein
MDTINAAPASCEVQAVISFLPAEGQRAAKTHRRLCRVYGENVTSDNRVREHCRKFRDGRTDVHDEGAQGQHSILSLVNSFTKSLGNFVDRIHGTTDHNNIRGLL